MTTDPTAVPTIVRAPWTPEQVDALNRFQRFGGMHPFTCGAEHSQGTPHLVALEDGWHCWLPWCDYRQDWAHAFMADPEALPSPANPNSADPAAFRHVIAAALRTTPATATADWPASSPHRTGPDTHGGHAYDARCALCAGDVAALTQAVLGVRDREMERLRGEVAGPEETAADRYQNMLHWQERAEEAEAERDAARATNQRLNLRCQQAESENATYRRAVAQWDVSERGTYIPHASLVAIGKAAGTDVLGSPRHLRHFERVEQAEAQLAAVRALGNRLAAGTEPFARAWGEELLGRVDADGGTS